jgi:NifU-like protein involved in Fe-S cluster formation
VTFVRIDEDALRRRVTERRHASRVKLGDLEALRGVVKFPVRIKCATLAWNTLVQGLEDAEANA